MSMRSSCFGVEPRLGRERGTGWVRWALKSVSAWKGLRESGETVWLMAACSVARLAGAEADGVVEPSARAQPQRTPIRPVE
jgi:hypothetical protein